MRKIINKVYSWGWRHSLMIGCLFIALYILLLFINWLDWVPQTAIGKLIEIEVIPVVVFLVMLTLVSSQVSKIWNYRQQRKKKDLSFTLSIWDIPKGLFIKTIACCMGFMWSAGWILYSIALWSNINSDGNYAEILGYAAMASLDLFMMDINGNILDNVNGAAGDPNLVRWPRLLKGAIVLVAILSALCTFAILINLFFSRFAAHIHSKLIKVTPKTNNHIYIFKGTGEKQQQLAKSIAKEDPRHLIVLVDRDQSRDSDEIDGLEKVISHLTLRNPVASKMNQNNHGIFLICDGSISDLSPEEIRQLSPSEFWSRMGLRRVHTLLEELNKNQPVKLSDQDDDLQNQVHFFFLSEDRDRNISQANVISDILMKNQYDNIKFSIYASARKDSVISVIEDKKLPENQSIRIIDDSRLSVDVLKRYPQSHPVRFVDIDLNERPGTVCSAFNALILGFGETGRDALRFLYEFSAFVDSSSDDNRRSPASIMVVDPKANILSGKFISDRPGLNTAYNIETNAGEPIIGFLPMDVRSNEFYQYIKKAITELNYIVVALGEDELNLTVATQLVKYARQYRPSLEKFKVFVRVYNDDSFSHFDDIIKHYNLKLKAECGIDSILESFGSVEDVYTYGLIIRDRFAVEGNNYGNYYWAYYEKVSSRVDQKKKEMGDTQSERALSDWEKKDKKKFNKFEDLQNALHSLTKLHIVESFLRNESGDVPAVGDEKTSEAVKPLWESLYKGFDVTPEGIDSKRIFSSEAVSYKDAPKISPRFDALLTNLAITEHLRWNASHEMLGFVYGHQKNYRTLTHNCLMRWDDLPLITDTNALRVYDYLVVETTLFLKKTQLEEEKKKEEKEKGKSN